MAINLESKLAGVLIPVFALKRKGDLKIGDTLAFKQAIDFCSRNKIAILQTLPINETSGDNSPYNAISSMAVEPCLLSMEPDLVPGLLQSDLDEAFKCIEKASDSTVDYGLVKSVKRKLFEGAYERLAPKDKSDIDRADFEKFKLEHAHWLKPYSLFRALMEEFGNNSNWTDWEEKYQSFQKAELAIKELKHFDKIKRLQELFSFIQWVGDTQWKDVKSHAEQEGIRLMGDIPFGVSRYSADVWSSQELFDLEMSGGAPPEPVFHGDEFTKRWGQNWGIPLYNWQKHKEEKFEWWNQRISRLVDHFHDFRIDHVLGFFRVYAFPWTPDKNHLFLNLTDEEASSKTNGVLPRFSPRDDETQENQVQNKTEGTEILKQIAETAGSGSIVAEDLGLIVPPYVRPAIHNLNMAGFAIPIFERDESTYEFKAIDSLNPLSLITYATHDHMPIKSYYKQLVETWLGPDGHNGWLEVQRLMRLLKLDDNNPPKEYTDELQANFIKSLVHSPCWLCVLMVTDLLGIETRFNQPGLSGGDCWSLRLEFELTEYETQEPYSSRIKSYRDLIQESSRDATLKAYSLKK